MLNTTGNATGSIIRDVNPGGTFQATITGTGTVACTVDIQASLDATNWVSLATITLSGTNSATDGFYSVGEWLYYRTVTTGATGTITSIDVIMTEVV